MAKQLCPVCRPYWSKSRKNVAVLRRRITFAKKMAMKRDIKRVMTLSWKVELDNADKIFSIDNDFFLIDNPVIASAGYPFKVDINVVLVCTSGYAKGGINLKSYVAQAPSVTIAMAGQISQYEHVSEDFFGLSFRHVPPVCRRFAKQHAGASFFAR
jgi:hypothetical protein